MMKQRRLWQVLPDLLTLSRPFFGLAISLVGVFGGREALPVVVFLLMVGWTTDIVDGRLAHWAKCKWQRRESWIGQNEIRADSLMLVGVIVYLGYVQLAPVWLTTSYASILFVLAVRLRSTYLQNLIFEAPATIATFLFLVILAGRPTFGYVAIWGFLLLLYDWKRAMELGGILKSTIARGWSKISQQPLRFGSLVFVLVVASAALSIASTQTKIIGGGAMGVFLLLLYLLWSNRT
jgi:hypothetical protein